MDKHEESENIFHFKMQDGAFKMMHHAKDLRC